MKWLMILLIFIGCTRNYGLNHIQGKLVKFGKYHYRCPDQTLVSINVGTSHLINVVFYGIGTTKLEKLIGKEIHIKYERVVNMLSNCSPKNKIWWIKEIE